MPAVKLSPTQEAELRYWVTSLSWGRPRNRRAAQTKLANLGLIRQITFMSKIAPPLYVATETGRAWIAAKDAQ